MQTSNESSQDEKARIRKRVSTRLLETPPGDESPIALPDAIFDTQLDHFITDFRGSGEATQRLVELPEWRNAARIFVTPDNSTQLLREAAILQGKEMIMTTYGIRRGSVLVTREMVPEGQEVYAATLVGMERYGRPLRTVEDLETAGRLDLMATGALAISLVHGGRAGKGAGWFDAEWGIWGALRLIQPDTPVIGIVHDIQVVPEDFPLDPWDCHINIIVTPSKVIRLPATIQPHGILWDQITTHGQIQWLAAIPYMRQLYFREFGKELPDSPA